MLFRITSAIVLVQWLLLGLVSVKAQSPTPACYTCPLTNGFDEKLELEVPDDTNFLCLYLSNDCFYDNQDGTLLNNEPGCPLEAVNDCVVRRELARQRALPRSPRPPSPGAFAAKPKVMHVRADLGYSKKQRAAKRDTT